MTAQPLENSLNDHGQLLAVLAERVGNMKETTDDFRIETRKAFEDSKQAMAELRTEVKNDGRAIREEMRQQFEQHNERISTLEEARAQSEGGLRMGRWLWGAAIAAVGLAATLISRITA